MDEIDRESWEKFDRHTAAVHEAGHLTVAYALGVAARGWIWRNEEADNSQEMRTFFGQVALCHRASPESLAHICAAGVMGEWYDGGQLNAADLADADITIKNDFEDIEWSPTDWAGLPEPYWEQIEVLQATFRILVENRELFQQLTAELKTGEGITDGMLRDIGHSHTARKLTDSIALPA